MSEGHSQLAVCAISQLEAQDNTRRNRKPRISEFHRVLERIAWMWRMTGVFPFTMKGPISARRYEINKFHAVYSFLVFLACFVRLSQDVMRHINSLKAGGISITPPIHISRMLATLLCVLMSNVWRIIRHKELSETINKMEEQHVILKRMGCLYEPKTKIIRAYVWATYAVMAWLISYSLYFIIAYWNDAIANKTGIGVFSLIVRIINLAIFVTLVGAIGLEFCALNEKIRSVVTRANATSPKIIGTSDVCAENILSISRAHFCLCAIGQRINNIFDSVVIINVTSAFVVSCTMFYYTFAEIQDDGETNWTEIFFNISIMINFTGPIIVIVLVCNWTSRQGKQAGKLIYEIQVEKTDCHLYRAVQLFSLQLRHQRLEFSAGGFFPLNSTLLQAMVANLTTYLVILIQFHPKWD